ncbi:biliverdin-producing heme oxygenase [Microbacterium sp. KUDC0406]|uniref:biliverdin-producing heme oxygenase n=1 Tax=Microbacterium sp. KUDC0406 TaxID=2909588 RepID=UPI001F1E43D0|nr:biliverdin-producing heme oxygenase [Microbacterium sp. KUDC0406]UJP08829.1 biliverdin-producing heme oxygenase [Microbacterium sp. KUDC0406]
MIIDDTVIGAVTAHMNGDHTDDNLLIARAFGHPGATAVVMSSLDARGGTWRVTDDSGVHDLTLLWPGGEVTERPQIRRAVVMLYRQACEQLGVPARQEHAPAGNGPHGAHGAHATDDESFARRLREATWGDHGDSEGASFMADIMRGKGTILDYTALVIQHYFMYEALEAASAQLLEDPVLAELHPEALRRMAALEQDLVHLSGPAWRDTAGATPATAAYAARINEIARERWVAGIIAHHYTRYLGDLSGGQVIARRVAKQFGFDADGVAFYDFSGLGGIDAFKNRYREVLDAFGAMLTADEQQRMLDEVRAAYHHNTAVFVDLDRERAAV